MMILAFTGMRVVVGVMIFTLSLLILVISYRKLLSYLGKGAVRHENYCLLSRLEIDPAKGKVQFYFTSVEKIPVKFQILDAEHNLVKEIFDAECKADGNIVHFDTTELENGVYFYSLVTPNQKTIKKMTVQN